MNIANKMQIKCLWCGRKNTPATVEFGKSTSGKSYINAVYICPCGDEFEIGIKGKAAEKFMEVTK